MKKFILASFILSGAAVFTAAADYSGGLRKNDGQWTNLNFYRMMHTANSFGPAYEDTYFEVEGGGRSGVLDFYYFFDINEICGWGTFDTRAGSFFTKVKPRLSLDGIAKRDLALGPVNEWYAAAQYKGFNGGEYYSAGLGTDWRIPGVELFQLNFWPKYVHFDGESKFNYAGLEVSLNWYKILRKFQSGDTVTYQGWLDYGFSNAYAMAKTPASTADEFQMFNGFFYNHGHYSASFSVKLHRHFSYYNQYYSNATTWFLGAHYRL